MPVNPAEYWSAISTKYDSVVDAQLGPNLRGLIRERLAREGDFGDALEIGCGSGMFTQVLAQKARRLVATDIALGMLEVARTAVQGRGEVTFQVEDCQKTSFADATFDTIFMALVLQFVDADVAIREMHRVLRPGGVVIIANLDVLALSIPLRLMLVGRTIYYAKVKYRRPMPRVTPKRLLTAQQLRNKLELAGFRLETLERIRDPSAAWNCPVNYVRAVKRNTA
jgi:ubiquinone/menaquinone biosynthesis C-methylase UbiE